MARLAITFALALMLFLLPRLSAATPPASESEGASSTADRAREPRWEMLAVGVLGVATGYGLANVVASSRSQQKDEAAGWLRVPIIGPAGYAFAYDDHGDLAIFGKAKNLALAAGLTTLEVGGVVLTAVGLHGRRTQPAVRARIAPGFVGVGGMF